MVKREIIRISVFGIFGVVIAAVLLYEGKISLGWRVVLLPFYAIGMFYAAGILLKMMGGVFRTYFSCQAMSLITNPLWGTIICLVLLFGGIWAILSFGWIIGIGRCIFCIFNAFQLDRQCSEERNEYYW